MINKLVSKGFKSIRVPVTWHNHLIDKKNIIDPNWMKRVKTIVDLCIKKGLYVMLNAHHDQAAFHMVKVTIQETVKKLNQRDFY